MRSSISFGGVNHTWKQHITQDRYILFLSVVLQLTLGVFFGHAYDMRIFMATGYLVGSGQNPYVAQDLSAVFQNISFQGMTSVGYPPPWPLVLGVLYRSVYALIPNLMVYNLVIKIPAIAANIGLAYLVAGPLADNVFEPLLEECGALSSTLVTGVVGAGAGRGIALIFIISALSLWITSAYAFANPRIHNLKRFGMEYSVDRQITSLATR